MGGGAMVGSLGFVFLGQIVRGGARARRGGGGGGVGVVIWVGRWWLLVFGVIF